MLAQARDRLPAPGALPGGLVFQPKFDVYRSVLFTPCPVPGVVVVQSCGGSLVQARFPDLVRAAERLPDGVGRSTFRSSSRPTLGSAWHTALNKPKITG